LRADVRANNDSCEKIANNNRLLQKMESIPMNDAAMMAIDMSARKSMHERNPLTLE